MRVSIMKTNKHHDEDQYLLKFNDRYFVTKDEYSMYLIIGKLGQIEPTEKPGILECWGCNKKNMLAGIPERKISSMLKILKNIAIKITRLTGEFLLQFQEKNIGLVCKVIKATKRRKLKRSHKKQLLIHGCNGLGNAHFNKKTASAETTSKTPSNDKAPDKIGTLEKI